MPASLIPITFDTSKTLAELESLKQTSYTATYTSHLAQTVAALHEKPLNLFEIEDVRMMIGQQRALEYLVPMALNILMQNPLAEGDYHAGDLLIATIKAKKEYWEAHQEYQKILEEIVITLIQNKKDDGDGECELNMRYITRAWEEVRGK